MIRIVFEGGLGNQIFEFVMGRYLQKYFNDEIEYNVSKYINEACQALYLYICQYYPQFGVASE